MQGGYLEHQRMLASCGAETRLIRSVEDLSGIEGLIIPGGESTTMQILLQRSGLWEEIRLALKDGLPAMGTCAGLILLSRHITDGKVDQVSFDCLDIAVRRNGYGRQRESFEVPLEVSELVIFPGVFIRAPRITDSG
ncbi:MAG: pyridoxal 5'-phosphate synthase glutaminase subunit PdxT, partial [Candidatus Dormibacteraceae bacterium]